MYGITTDEDIPAACRTEQTAWDDLIAGIWRSVLEPFCLPQAQTAVEIGPGLSCKIAMAFSKLKFHGKIYVVDASKNAAVTMERKYREYCPDAEVISLHKGLRELLPELPVQPDLLLLSHAIDDMLMYEATRQSPQANRIFDWCAHNAYELAPTKLYHEVWRQIEQNPVELQKTKEQVLALLLDLVKTVRPQVMVLSQYPSATLTENGLGNMNDHTHDVFLELNKRLSSHLWPTAKIQSLLDKNKNYNHDHIGNNILNASHWLIYED